MCVQQELCGGLQRKKSDFVGKVIGLSSIGGFGVGEEIICLLRQSESAASRQLRTGFLVGACARRSRLQPCICLCEW